METCWAHNPDVRGSKPCSASIIFSEKINITFHYIFSFISSTNGQASRVAQWKRAGPITQMSVDRNHALLVRFLVKKSTHHFITYLVLYPVQTIKQAEWRSENVLGP